MLNLYPKHIFFDKVINQITHRKNKLWRFLPASRISLSGIGTIPDKASLRERLTSILGDVQGIVNQISGDERATILSSANLTLEHQFDYLGSGLTHMPFIRWHEDFKSGSSWKKGVFYLKQRRSTANGADIKVPWELSRCHHLLWLGEAYLLTRDDKYASEVVQEIDDWRKENPFMYSVNWTCTMDVSIRVVNWMYAIGMVLDSRVVSESFVQEVFRSIFQHGWFIFNNLERTIPYSNNHLFSDLSGLLFVSFLLKDTKRGRKWLRYSKDALFDEIRCQVLPSGAHYERSLSYHRLMTEMVASSIQLMMRQGISVPGDIEYRLSSMYSFISAYTKPNSFAPLLEDNDDGRFLPFVKRDFRNHSYLLDDKSAESLFLAEGSGHVHFNSVQRSQMFQDVGHCVLRTNEAYLIVTNGEQSGYEVSRSVVGTHTHNDKLSFELALGQEDLIVDPGAYIYTPDPVRSNEFRSTAKHNTVVVDSEEQNEISPKNVFLAGKNSRAFLFRLCSDDCVEGEYKTFKEGLIHYRRLQITNDSLLITDSLSKKGKGHEAVFSFHLAESVQPILDGNEVSISTERYQAVISFTTRAEGLRVQIEDDTVSPSYGVLKKAKTIRVELSFEDSLELNTCIKWQKKK